MIKHIFFKVLLILGLAISTGYADEFFTDTLESGSSDSVKVLRWNDAAVYVKCIFRQLDTNTTFPDSVVIYDKINNTYAPMGFNESKSDSTFNTEIVFTYSLRWKTGDSGQIRAGWVNQPAATELTLLMSNLKYLTNRKIYYEILVVTK